MKALTKIGSAIKSVAMKLLPFLVLVLLLELLARLAGSVVQDKRTYRELCAKEKLEAHVYSPSLGWTRRPRFQGPEYSTWCVFDKRGYFVEDGRKVKSGVKPRILVLGDSCSFGFGVLEDATYGRILEKLLPAYDVINLAVPGYTSCQGRRVLDKQIDRLKPALVIAAFSLNDRRYVVRPQDADGSAHFRVTYLSNYLFPRLRCFSGLVRGLTALLPAPPKPADEAFVDRIVARVSPENYKANLTAIVETAKQRKVPVILLAMADSPSWQAGLQRGLELIRKGEWDEGMKGVWAIAQNPKDEYSTVASRFLLEQYRAKGLAKDAESARKLVTVFHLLHGGLPLYLDTEYVAIMKSVAETQHALFVDAGAEMAKNPGMFIDFCHFNAGGHALIADMLAKQIKALPVLP